MTAKPTWTDSMLGKQLDDLVRIPVPASVAAAIGRFCEQKRTGSIVVEFHIQAGRLRKVKRSEVEEEAIRDVA